MNTADLFERIIIDSPGSSIGKVPLRPESIRQNYVITIPVFLADPVVAISGYHSGFVRNSILLTKSVSHLARAVKDLNVIIDIQS